MPHVRILRHYIHTPVIIMSLVEGLLIAAAAYLGHYTAFQQFPEVWGHLTPALTFSIAIVLSMNAMNVYESRIREGYPAMLLRTAISMFLLGTMAVAMLAYFFPPLGMARGVLLFSTAEAFVLVAAFRWITGQLVSEDAFKKRVVVFGTGQRALKIATRMRRRYDRRGFVLLGFIKAQDTTDLVSESGAKVVSYDEPLVEYCNRLKVDEIVVAIDERRRNVEARGGMPLDELLECRLVGIEVCDVQAFIERECSMVDVDLLRPSWMVFSDGFVLNVWRSMTKRGFDVLASLILLLFTFPIMLVTAFLIWVEGRFKDPILYRQVRVGLDSRMFEVLKFRSMRVDAETPGSEVWADEDESRSTRIGNLIRNSHIDELPQLFNVLRGDMSFVGPRPERPVFVKELEEQIPFYAQRHHVKPGITGWAQLCYPYGASIDDAKQKLQYDLYYLKNHSILLDLIILLQTVEVVLVGEGAR
ncbi:MAG: TIGR03013 family PEP-CTERM/XrtA system glycosyltransferase [Gammaproteobacteria bacterium]|nr:TIGR03013 family PEP-CTERM/XrtA system glycosyltransferase [Gammaproteobacteria bacterium]